MSEPVVVHIDEIEGVHGGVFKPRWAARWV
jgi:hypothetical protein